MDGTFEGDYMDQPRPEHAAAATVETPHHPSPSKRFNPLKPFETNLSSIRHREEPDSTPSVDPLFHPYSRPYPGPYIRPRKTPRDYGTARSAALPRSDRALARRILASRSRDIAPYVTFLARWGANGVVTDTL